MESGRTDRSQEHRPRFVSSIPGYLPTKLLYLLNLGTLFILCCCAIHIHHKPLQFDDAFMFERYALHLRQGIGISWNSDAIHTGGMTSLGWFCAVVPVSYLPLREGQPLAMASFVAGLAGILLLAWQIPRLSSSPLFTRFWLILPTLTLLLLLTPLFRSNMATGMDTMLSFAFNAGLSISLWNWVKYQNTSKAQAAWIGLLGACTVLVRPENGIFAIGAPLLASVLLFAPWRSKQMLCILLTFASSMLICALIYHAYFHDWVPLSFYVKSRHFYLGYIGTVKWAPEKFLAQFLLLALPVLAFALASLCRRTLPIAVTFLLPLIFTFAYLQSVMQIMGFGARYYIPFLAPVIVAACWMSDIALQGDWRLVLRRRLYPAACGLAALLLLIALCLRPLAQWSKSRLRVAAYPAPALITPAASPLPQRPRDQLIDVLARQVIQPLPSGTVIAASEIGLIGAVAPHIDVIDLAGLNDTDIARNGFDINRLLDRKPDLIWFPHTDYTWQRQAMFCSPRLAETYAIIGGDAFNYSLAIRRHTPQTAQIMQLVTQAFSQIYPGATLQNYIVFRVECNARSFDPRTIP